MPDERYEAARDRLIELVNDPAIAGYVVSYLLGSIDERYWPHVVQSALDHADRCAELRVELYGHSRRPLDNRR